MIILTPLSNGKPNQRLTGYFHFAQATFLSQMYKTAITFLTCLLLYEGTSEVNTIPSRSLNQTRGKICAHSLRLDSWICIFLFRNLRIQIY